MKPIPLNVDGANPLGFLAAVGVVRLLCEKKGKMDAPDVRLSWSGSRRPVVVAQGVEDGAALVELIAELARRRTPGQADVEAERRSQSAWRAARKAADAKAKAIKKLRLPRDKRKAAFETEHAPLAEEVRIRRAEWRVSRVKAAPDVAVSMGLDLNVTSEEFAGHCYDALDASTMTFRRWVDFCASFGAEGPRNRIDATPFSLISGSGKQWFLDTAGKLMVACSVEHFRKALLGSWVAEDDRCSFRWDSADDRRHALLANNPSASGNKPKTIWGANRLAFEALRLFPCMRARTGPATVGWRHDGESEVWRWPLWTCNLSPAVISSILASRDIWRDDPESRRRLRERGVFAVFQTRRITVGRAPNQKLNFSPSVPVWWSTSAAGSRHDLGPAHQQHAADGTARRRRC